MALRMVIAAAERPERNRSPACAAGKVDPVIASPLPTTNALTRAISHSVNQRLPRTERSKRLRPETPHTVNDPSSAASARRDSVPVPGGGSSAALRPASAAATQVLQCLSAAAAGLPFVRLVSGASQ